MSVFKFNLSNGTDVFDDPKSKPPFKRLLPTYSLDYKPPIPSLPCLHKQCPECHGGGRKRDGTICIHWIYCSCPMCSPWS